MHLRLIKITLLLLFSHSVFSQTPAQLLETVKDKYSVEKIHIHFDRNAYLAGQTIYYKAYIMHGFLPTDLSTAINVEILNDSGRVLIHQTLPVISGTATGTMVLSTELEEGNYRVRAFTPTMMNYGTAMFYTSDLDIFNPRKSTAKIQNVAQYSLQFLPEGGDLVPGVKSKVAFICTDQLGQPVNISGTIRNAENKTVADFKTLHNGMGYVYLTPSAGETYTALYTAGDQQLSVRLPEASHTALALSVSRTDGKLYFEIHRSALSSPSSTPSYLIGQIENNIAFNMPLNSVADVKGLLPESSLPSGILQLTVFNNLNQPLAERLVFINNDDYTVPASLSILTKNLSPRKKNELLLNVGGDINGLLSLSITDADDPLASTSAGDNIVSAMLMSENLKGKIHDAASYFKTNTKEDKDNLDLVMLTHGWRRYSWPEILSNQFPSMNILDPGYITLSGTVYKANSTQPFPKAELSVNINTRDSGFNMLTVDADEKGNFIIPGLTYIDTASFTFRNQTDKKNKTSIALNPVSINQSFTTISAPAGIRSDLPESQVSYVRKYFSNGYQDDGKITLLQGVTVSADSRTPAEKTMEKYASPLLGRNANSTIDLINDPPASRAMNILDFLKGRLMSVNITGSGAAYNINYRNTRSLLGGPIPMTVLVDDAQVTAAQAALLRVEEVAMVQVFSTSLLAAAGGVLAIYRRKDSDRTRPDAGSSVSSFLVPGFAPVKDFYSPDYTLPQDLARATDTRTTLLWNPYLTVAPGQSSIKIPFYNTDNCKRFKVVVQGMSEEGKFVNLEQVIE